MIDGALLIGGEARQATDRFTAVNPATGETLSPDFSSAGTDAVAEACALAEAAFPAYAATARHGPPSSRESPPTSSRSATT
jgi:2,5-dioxopentanoate dehydrogenase